MEPSCSTLSSINRGLAFTNNFHHFFKSSLLSSNNLHHFFKSSLLSSGSSELIGASL
ncbi:hypothetical protein Hdeb2414_s0025g00666701 [Helianthus debilis subsp. tardiflorus]